MLMQYKGPNGGKVKRPTTVGGARSRSASATGGKSGGAARSKSPPRPFAAPAGGDLSVLDFHTGAGVSECAVCRTLCETYAASLVAEKTQISPFDRLVAQDFIPAKELAGGQGLCRFHAYWKRRFDILAFINKGLRENIRYEALYDLLAALDPYAKESFEWLLTDIKTEVENKQVRTSLIKEARRLTDLWDAQVEDLDTQIAYSIGDLQSRQAQDLAFEFENLESAYAKKKVHYSSALLELFQQEPRMKSAGAFNEALKVVDAGKKLEQIQTMRFKREMEREKSLKLSWKVCQQTRQINGIVDKMQRHRRKEEANREIDRERLKSRVKTALLRLEKVQRQALVVMRPPFLQHIYRVRHLVEVESKKDQQNPDAFKPRPALYEGPGQTSFRTRDTDDLGRDVRGVDTYPESSTELFYRMIMGKMPDPLPERSSPSKSLTTRQRPMSQNGRRPIGPMPVQTSTRPKSAPLVNNSQLYNLQSRMGINCDWCGTFTTQPTELELETDMPASVQRALDSTEFANVALSAPSADSLIPGPRGIPDVTNNKKKKTSMQNLKTLIEAQNDDGVPTVVARCCSFSCMYSWNTKNSPTYLRSRRHLQIDLMQRTARKETGERLPDVALHKTN
ncbi:unnamed protein product [Amoebophrya sp. A25]|nr:unnamed protein product [Amoebophrya sp. A25]|eukprot:GSA25T00021068001.1